VTCESCAEGEHAECEDPEETIAEWDTGHHNVSVCCCGPPDPQFDTREEQAEFYEYQDDWVDSW
jgi:hypothetical protein